MSLTFSIMSAWALATIRATLFFIICPPFNNRAITGRIKAMMGLAMGMATMGFVRPVYSTGEFIAEAIIQAVIGFGMGFIIYVVVAAIRSAGSFLDLQGGFAMAQAFDPMSMTQGAVYAKLYGWMALVLLFASNGYQLVILGLAKSYQVLPVGGGMNWGRLAQVIGAETSQLFVAAVLIGGPLLAVLFLTDVGLGLLTKVAPAMNVFALGFPLKILIAIATIPLLVMALPRVVDETIKRAVEVMGGVL